MVAPAVEDIDLCKIAGRSISGWIKSLKTGTASHIRQPFCSQLEERLLLWLEYHPQVVSDARGDIGTPFAKTHRLPTPKDAPFAIGYTFEGKPHDSVSVLWYTVLFRQNHPDRPNLPVSVKWPIFYRIVVIPHKGADYVHADQTEHRVRPRTVGRRFML